VTLFSYLATALFHEEFALRQERCFIFARRRVFDYGAGREFHRHAATYHGRALTRMFLFSAVAPFECRDGV